MKVTIEIPNTAKVMTYQVVYDDFYEGNMKIISRVLDTEELNRMQEEQSHEEA